MYPPEFEYFCPDDLDEVLRLLERFGDDAKVLAGGQSLIPMMKLRLAAPRALVDINHVEALTGIHERDGAIVFGACCRYAEVESSPLVSERLPILIDAAAVTADVQVRNRGTIGGSLAHADPAGDWAPPLLALDAGATIRGPKGERTLSVEELLEDAYSPDLRADELLTHVSVPARRPPSSGAYVKFEKRSGDFAVASVGVQLRVDEDGRCRDVRVGVGALGATAVRARGTEAVLEGDSPSADVIGDAAKAIQDAIDPFDDTRGTVAYKRHLAEVVFEKAFVTALARARGERVATQHL